MVKLDPEPITDGAFHAEANVRELPGLGIGSWACSNLRIARSRAMLTDGKDDFVLTIITSGQVSASQRGRDIELGPGQAVLMSAAEAGDMATTLSPSRFFGLRLPRKALASLGSMPEDMMMRTLSANSEALRLLAFYVRELDDGYQLATPELVGAVVTHLTDLGALIIGANRDGTVVAEDRGLAAARLAAVKADIRKNLSYGDLNAAGGGGAVEAYAAPYPAAVRKRGFDLLGIRARPAPGACSLAVDRPDPDSQHHRHHRVRGGVRRSLLFQPHVPPALRCDAVGNPRRAEARLIELTNPLGGPFCRLPTARRNRALVGSVRSGAGDALWRAPVHSRTSAWRRRPPSVWKAMRCRRRSRRRI